MLTGRVIVEKSRWCLDPVVRLTGHISIETTSVLPEIEYIAKEYLDRLRLVLK